MVRIHHDTYMTGNPEQKLVCQKRDDITLLVRKFNYPLSTHSPPGLLSFHPSSTPLYQPSPPRPPALQIPTPPPMNGTMHNGDSGDSPQTPTNQIIPGIPSAMSTNSSQYLQVRKLVRFQ